MYVSKILPGWPDQDPSLSLGMMYSNSVLHHPSNQIQDHQSLPYCCPAKGAFFPTELKVFTASKTMLSQQTPCTIRLGLYYYRLRTTQVTTMQGQVAKIVIVMEYYLAARGDLTLYFGLITRNNYHNITLGKKRHHHSKPTDQKYSTLSQ